MPRFPQALKSFEVSDKPPLNTLPRTQREIERVERELGAKGRVLVRYSGTEAKLRLLVEGPTPEITDAGLAALEVAARNDLTVL